MAQYFIIERILCENIFRKYVKLWRIFITLIMWAVNYVYAALNGVWGGKRFGFSFVAFRHDFNLPWS